MELDKALAIAVAAMGAEDMRLGASAKGGGRALSVTAGPIRLPPIRLPGMTMRCEHGQGANFAVLHATRAMLARVIAMLT